MATDALATWKSTFKTDIPNAKSKSEGAQNFANWADARVTSKIKCAVIQGGNITYTFNKATYKTALENLPLAKTALEGISNFANAWLSAINLTVVVMAVGSSIGVPSNATTWSAITTTTVDSASKTLGVNKIKELVSSPKASDPANSEVPIKLREAFLLETITTTGLDSTPPAGGPLPLVDALRAVI